MPLGRRLGGSRRGVAATEFAVCLPIICLILLGTIECCTMIFLKQSLSVAAYEAARTGLEPNAKPGDIRRAARQVLRDRGVKNATITIDPNAIHQIVPGTYFTVTVTAPCDKNAVLPTRFFQGDSLSATATFMKELQGSQASLLRRFNYLVARWLQPAPGNPREAEASPPRAPHGGAAGHA